MKISDVSETITMYSDNGCSYLIEGLVDGGEYFDRNLNVILSAGWRLIHLGQETDRSEDGVIWDRTIAIFGK